MSFGRSARFTDFLSGRPPEERKAIVAAEQQWLSQRRREVVPLVGAFVEVINGRAGSEATYGLTSRR